MAGSVRAQTIAQTEPAFAADRTALAFGHPVARDISGGQKHEYQAELTGGQFARIIIKQTGIDLGVVERPATGDPYQVYEPFGGLPELSFSFVTERAGIYTTDLYTTPRAAGGRYEISLAELRPADEKDRELFRANQLLDRFIQLNREGKYFDARRALTEALQIRERWLGPDDRLVARTLSFLSGNYEATGDYATAETMKLRSVAVLEKAVGPDHPDVAYELSQLAGLYAGKGDSVKAEEVSARVLSILERAGQGDSAIAGATLDTLGTIYYDRGDYVHAEKYYQRSREVWEKLLGPDHFHLAPSYSYLGRVAYDRGDYARAETIDLRAIALVEKALGPDSTTLTRYLNQLATVYVTMGRFDEAEALYRRAIANHEKRKTLAYPSVQEALWGLGRLYLARGKFAEAVQVQTRATEADEQYAKLNLAIGSEREKFAFVEDLHTRMFRDISLHVGAAPNDPAARDLAITSILQGKGRVQDAVGANLTALRSRFAPPDQALLDQLNAVTAKLARQVLGRRAVITRSETESGVEALEAEKDRLEEEVSRRSGGYYRQLPSASLANVQAAIPENAALIEFAVYRPFDPKAPDRSAFGPPRYVAYVLRRQGPSGWRDLGPTAPIDAAVATWRQALGDPKRTDANRLARAVDAKVMEPLRLLTGDADQLLISPDGELNLIPFGALVDQRGQYLLQRYSFAFLTSGRDLLRMNSTAAAKSKPLVIANPAFGESGPDPIARRGHGTADPRARIRASVTTGTDLATTYFAPLEGTVREADSIAALFPEASILTGTGASKAALAQVTAPRILHIATHGFFLAGPDDLDSAEPGNSSANPLLRSGLALAGANLRDPENNGILTAMEASGLNLWGTKLVVLSACNTGVGEVRNGEGVYGLRRAFVLAGAETLVMSLWPVSDLTTRQLMAAYYRNLKQGLGRGEALRNVQLDMLRRDPHLHPFYWANFVQSGEWANLDGTRK
jgi:CHAT domain-containing protein